uniref:Putative secreted protein n=1 Tax=Anopheles darlingi TaxID=43151 RepID=A0A2M4DE47_ANODA
MGASAQRVSLVITVSALMATMARTVSTADTTAIRIRALTDCVRSPTMVAIGANVRSAPAASTASWTCSTSATRIRAKKGPSVRIGSVTSSASARRNGRAKHATSTILTSTDGLTQRTSERVAMADLVVSVVLVVVPVGCPICTPSISSISGRSA